MSDFLFRMVARAAGLAPQGPRPRSEVQAPPALDTAVPAAAKGPAPAWVNAVPPAEEMRTAAPASVSDVLPILRIQPEPALPRTNEETAGTIAPTPHTESGRPAQPSPARRLEVPVLPLMTAAPAPRVTSNFPPQPLPAGKLETPAPPVMGPKKADQPPAAEELEVRSPDREIQTVLPIHVVPKVVPVSVTQPVARPDRILTDQTKIAQPEKEEHPAVPLPTQATPPSRPRQANLPKKEQVASHQEEPPVEVKIGRVEVLMEAAPVAPPAPARPQGFAEYTALRRYVARPWDFRNR